MKIIYMGTPDLATPPLEALAGSHHEICLVVTQPDRPKGRGKKEVAPPVKVKAQELGFKVSQPPSLKDPLFRELLVSQEADLIVVVAFSILPMSVIETARLGAINMHASLLPKYRGAAPIQWALYHGEPTTGVSIFQLDAKMDHGEVLGQSEVPITREDNTATLGKKIISAGTTLILSVIQALEEGNSTALEQDHTLATPARKLKKTDGQLNWKRTAEENFNQIRAFNPYPIAFSHLPELNNKVLRIHHSSVTEEPSPSPGQVKISSDGFPLVGCADYYLKLETVQLEGKGALEANHFINGIKGHTTLTQMV